MIDRLRGGLTYANVVATLALFVALAGTAYAATRITGEEVVNGSLTGADIARDSVGGRDIKNLTPKDFRGGTIVGGERTIVQEKGNIEADGTAGLVAQCPGTTTASGGGYEISGSNADVVFNAAAGDDWALFVQNGTPGTQIAVSTVCLP